MQKITITDDLIIKDNKWQYRIKFSDNPFTMIYENEDILQCQKIRNVLNNRIIKFFKKETDILKTSDLNFKYVK